MVPELKFLGDEESTSESSEPNLILQPGFFLITLYTVNAGDPFFPSRWHQIPLQVSRILFVLRDNHGPSLLALSETSGKPLR